MSVGKNKNEMELFVTGATGFISRAVVALTDGKSYVVHRVIYRILGRMLGRLLHKLIIGKTLKRIFN